MASGRCRFRSRVLPTCLLLAAGVPIGCAQPGPIASRQTTLGSLKSSVSQLEFDNEGLKKQLADLKADNRRLENQLSQEQEANGEVTAQLDDARDLLRRQGGGNATALGPPTKSASFDDDAIPPPVTRRARNGRKPPAAAIPRVESSSWSEPDPDSAARPREVGPQSRLDDFDDRWLPVARGMGTPIRF